MKSLAPITADYYRTKPSGSYDVPCPKLIMFYTVNCNFRLSFGVTTHTYVIVIISCSRFQLCFFSF